MNAENRVFLELYTEYNKDIPNMRSINAWNLGMQENIFNYALQKLQDKNIISGLKVTRGYDGTILKVYLDGVRLTENAGEYYNTMICYNNTDIDQENRSPKKRKIFISHSSADVKYVTAVIELIEAIGVPEDGIFCSSLPGYGIPLGENIYDYIREQLLEYRIKACVILSDNFYRSEACLNEMGVIGFLKQNYFQIFLPGFNPDNRKGVLCSDIIGIKLDDDLGTLKERLREMRDDLLSFFGLPSMSEAKWERKRNEFIESVVPKASV